MSTPSFTIDLTAEEKELLGQIELDPKSVKGGAQRLARIRGPASCARGKGAFCDKDDWFSRRRRW